MEIIFIFITGFIIGVIVANLVIKRKNVSKDSGLPTGAGGTTHNTPNPQ